MNDLVCRKTAGGNPQRRVAPGTQLLPYHNLATFVSRPPLLVPLSPSNQGGLLANPEHPRAEVYPLSWLMGFLLPASPPKKSVLPILQMALIAHAYTLRMSVHPHKLGMGVLLHLPRWLGCSDSWCSQQCFLCLAGEKQPCLPIWRPFSPGLPALLSPL